MWTYWRWANPWTGLWWRRSAPWGVPVRCARAAGAGCGRKGERLVELVDLPAFGRRVRLEWRKRRWECLDEACGAGSFTEQDPRIAPERGLLTCRAGRWSAEMVGREGRTVSAVARELGCDWHTVNKEVVRWGEALLDADEGRIGAVEAVGVDETMFLRTAPRRRPEKRWCTSIVDVQAGQLLDIVPGREAAGPARWLRERPAVWREQTRLGGAGPLRPVPGRLQRGDPSRYPGRRFRSMSYAWPTTGSTRSAAGSRTRPWAIGAAKVIPCTGSASC